MQVQPAISQHQPATIPFSSVLSQGFRFDAALSERATTTSIACPGENSEKLLDMSLHSHRFAMAEK